MNSQRNDVIIRVITHAWENVTKHNELIRSFKCSNQKLSEKGIEVQEETIKLQADLVQSKDEQFQKIRAGSCTVYTNQLKAH